MAVNTTWIDPSSGGSLDLTTGDVVTESWVDGVVSDILSLGGSKGLLPVCQGRLTLTSGTPVTTADVIGATSIYFTPYMGDRIALFDGTLWKTLTFTERTLSLGTLTSGLPYDVFAYDSSGTVTLESLAWTNNTTRATALTLQNGIFVKTGATTRRYLGTFYTTSTTTTEDSTSKRFLWNYYNRFARALSCKDTTNSWTYTTSTYRSANNDTTDGVGRFSCVVGVVEDTGYFFNQALANSSVSTQVASGIGINSTSVNSAIAFGHNPTSIMMVISQCSSFLSAGFNYIQRLEYSQAAGTTTWYGDDGGTNVIAGMTGEIKA